MTDFELPEDLTALERDLTTALPGNPPPELRDRVIESARVRSIASQRETEIRRRFTLWVVTTVVLLVWMNLSFLASHTLEPLDRTTAGSSIDVSRKIALLQELVPELDTEAALSLSFHWVGKQRGLDTEYMTLDSNSSYIILRGDRNRGLPSTLD